MSELPYQIKNCDDLDATGLKDDSYKIYLDDGTKVKFTVRDSMVNGLVEIIKRNNVKYTINYDDNMQNGLLQKYKGKKIVSRTKIINDIIYK